MADQHDDNYDIERVTRHDDDAGCAKQLAQMREGALWRAFAAHTGRPLDELLSLAVVAVGRKGDDDDYIVASIEGELSPMLVQAIAEMHNRMVASLVRDAAGEDVPPERRPS